MDLLLDLDRQFFLLINHLPHPFWFNLFAKAISGVYGSSLLIWLILGLMIFYREAKRNHFFWLPFFSAGLLSTLMTNFVLKPFFARIRPPLELGAIILQVTRDFSFPSGHATFAFAMAKVLSAQEPSWGKWLYLLAVLIALSRVYLGVHYPLDVLIGGLMGWLIGLVSLRLFNFPAKAKKPAPRRSGKFQKK